MATDYGPKVRHGERVLCSICGVWMCQLEDCAEHKTHDPMDCAVARDAVADAVITALLPGIVHHQATEIADEL